MIWLLFSFSFIIMLPILSVEMGSNMFHYEASSFFKNFLDMWILIVLCNIYSLTLILMNVNLTVLNVVLLALGVSYVFAKALFFEFENNYDITMFTIGAVGEVSPLLLLLIVFTYFTIEDRRKSMIKYCLPSNPSIDSDYYEALNADIESEVAHLNKTKPSHNTGAILRKLLTWGA